MGAGTAGARGWAARGSRARRECVGRRNSSVGPARAPQRLPEDAVCRSPIAGLVITVLATVGQQVSRRQAVMVIEAMKMQNNVCPAVDGVLKAVHVSPGDAVKAGQVLFELA